MNKEDTLKTLLNTVGNIAYIDHAQKSSRLLIILHPYGKDAHFAIQNFRFLEKDFHLIIPDLPFHGKTSLLKDVFSSEDLASIIDSLAGLYPEKTLSLLGHSLGARIASLASPHLDRKVEQTLFYGPEGISTPFTSFFFQTSIYKLLKPLRYLFVHTTFIETMGQLLYELKLLNKIAFRFLQLHSSKSKKKYLLSLWKSLSNSAQEMNKIIQAKDLKLGQFDILIGKQDKTTPFKSVKGTNWERYTHQVEGGHFYLKEETKEKIRHLLGSVI